MGKMYSQYVEDSKYLARRNWLSDAATHTAETFSEEIRDIAEVSSPITFDEDSKAFNDAIKKYFDDVQQFKDDNDFCDGDLINYSKIASLTMQIFRDMKPQELFILKNEDKYLSFVHFAVPYFVFRFTCIFLKIDADDVQKRSPGLVELFLRNLVADREVHVEWLFWSMQIFEDLGKAHYKLESSQAA